MISAPLGHPGVVKRTAASIAAVALVVAGCGSEKRLTKAQYSVELRAAAPAIDRGCGAAGATSTREVARAIDRCRAVLARESKRLRALRPPNDVEAANTELADGFDQLRARLARVGPPLARGDVAAASRALYAAFSGATHLDHAQRVLIKHGYVTELIGLP